MKVWNTVLLLSALWCATAASDAAAQVFDPAEYVRTLYRYDLGREGDSGEVELWTRNILKGVPPETVRASILGSEELFKRCDRSLSRYLGTVSVHVYQRPATLEELRAWSNRLVALGGNRVALCLELLQDAARHPAPPPVVVVARPALPAEPVPIATPNAEIVAQAEAAVVLVDLFLADVARCGNPTAVASVLADARKLQASLHTVRRLGAEGAARSELRIRLRDTNDDWGIVRDRRHALNVAIPALRLPAMAEVNDAMERLGQLIRN